MNYSFIIPVYNRPEEIDELLLSMTHLKELKDYEVIIVEDGSSLSSESVVDKYKSRLNLHYLKQSNTGPSGARNRGAKLSTGEWLIFLDSDTILPPEYFIALTQNLASSNIDLWGGPDRANESFTPIQKGINYSMTSLLTTGGIRGGTGTQPPVGDLFYPRSFNMGIKKKLYDHLKGFTPEMRYGEDLDLSMRAWEEGAISRCLPEVWLFHKRRTSFDDFFSQVEHSGEARWALNRRHPGTLRVVHWLPSLFILTCFFCLPVVLMYGLILFTDALTRKYSFKESIYCVAASFVQHWGYGIGFIKGAIK